MRKNIFHVQHKWVCFIIFFGLITYLQPVVCCKAGSNQYRNFTLHEISTIKADNSITPQEKAGRINHVFYRLSDQELMAAIEAMHMSTPVYHKIVTRQNNPSKRNINQHMMEQAIQDALSHPEQKQRIVDMLINYMLNSKTY